MGKSYNKPHGHRECGICAKPRQYKAKTLEEQRKIEMIQELVENALEEHRRIWEEWYYGITFYP